MNSTRQHTCIRTHIHSHIYIHTFMHTKRGQTHLGAAWRCDGLNGDDSTTVTGDIDRRRCSSLPSPCLVRPTTPPPPLPLVLLFASGNAGGSTKRSNDAHLFSWAVDSCAREPTTAGHSQQIVTVRWHQLQVAAGQSQKHVIIQ